MTTQNVGISSDEEAKPPRTLPNISVQILGIPEDDATKLGQAILAYAGELSRYMDLERLDGFTVSNTYAESLATLDRGYETSHKLEPSTEFALGVAMTPSVKRDGVIKSHILFDVNFIWGLQDPENEYFEEALHVLAHECAHVEVTKTRDVAFPGTLLSKRYDNVLDGYKGQIISACWDEYAACRISAGFGKDSSVAYTTTFLVALKEARLKANDCIRAYRTHGDHGQVLTEVAGYYGDLLKFASYLLGHMDGVGLSLSDLPEAASALEDHWFAPFFERLHDGLREIWSQYGAWTAFSTFDVIGAIVIDLLAAGGMTFFEAGEGKIGFEIPYTRDTMPEGFEWLGDLVS